MVTKEELHSLLESLPEAGLEQVHRLMVVLLQEFEDISEVGVTRIELHS